MAWPAVRTARVAAFLAVTARHVVITVAVVPAVSVRAVARKTFPRFVWIFRVRRPLVVQRVMERPVVTTDAVVAVEIVVMARRVTATASAWRPPALA